MEGRCYNPLSPPSPLSSGTYACEHFLYRPTSTTSHSQYLVVIPWNVGREHACTWISLQHIHAACLVCCDNNSLHNSLWNCSVISQGAKAIADGLRTNTSLKTLEYVSPPSGQCIILVCLHCHCCLFCSLSDNVIGDDGVERLAQALCISRTLEDLW